MATQFNVPREVVADIRDWARRAELRTVADFPQVAVDEDAVAESLGTRLRCGTKTVDVSEQEASGSWSWSISHTRFRGRGGGAEEKTIGADLIVELELRYTGRYRTSSKALLIQAKKNWRTDSRVFRQAAKLLTWREAAVVVNLTARSIEAYYIDDVIAGKGRRPETSAGELSGLLAGDFVSGGLGDESIVFDARKRALCWVDTEDTFVKCSFQCGHRVTILIVPPAPMGPPRTAVAIRPEEVHQHRLKVSPREVLGLPHAHTEAMVNAAVRRRHKVYHPDRHSLTPEVDEAFKRESQIIKLGAFGAGEG